MKRWRTIVLVMLSLLILVGCVRHNENKTNDLDLLGDIYLYEYRYENLELPENYYKDSNYRYILFVTSIDVKNIDTPISHKLSIEIKGIDDYGKRMFELEDNDSLTIDIFSDKVELSPTRKYHYFIYQIGKDVEDIRAKNVYIKYNEEVVEKVIDVYMVI